MKIRWIPILLILLGSQFIASAQTCQEKCRATCTQAFPGDMHKIIGCEKDCIARNCQTLPPTHTGTVTPAYYLVTVLYAPPGNKSKASYFQGSSAGTTTDAADLFGAGVKVGLTGNVIATVDFQYTQQTSNSFKVTKTAKAELDNFGVTDTIRHGQDMFYLWLNPVIKYSQEQSPGMPINISFGTAGGADMDVVSFTADELMHKEPIPPEKSAKLKNLTDTDFAQILSADPFLSPGYTPDPHRYTKVMTLNLDGPDNPGDDLSGQGYNVDDSQLNCTTNTDSLTSQADFGGSGGVDVFGQGEKAIAVLSVFWKATSSFGRCNGTSQAAVIDLVSSTVGFHDKIDVWEDSIFHSFAYVSETQGVGFRAESAGISGVVTNSAGTPLAKQLIVVKFADGSTQKLFSNAQGKYRIFNLHPGPVTLTVGRSVRKVTFVPGHPIVKKLTATRQPTFP